MNFESKFIEKLGAWGAPSFIDDSWQFNDSVQEDYLEQVITYRLLSGVFQPIVDISRIEIFGFEGLIRGPSNSRLHMPFDLFREADLKNLTFEVEHLSRQVLLEQFSMLNTANKKLFINMSPALLMQSKLDKGETIAFIHRLGLKPQDLIIEITEQNPTLEYKLLSQAIEKYRDIGFEIAMDDLGEGFSSLRLWSEIKPNFVKIDKHFVRDIHQDQVKFEFVRSIQQIAENSGAKVIAEGIETIEELEVIKDLKISFGQGYLFGRPESHLVKSVPENIASLLAKNAVYVYQNSTISLQNRANVSKLVRYVTPIKSNTINDHVIALFEGNPQLKIIPVVDNDKPVGLISRYSFIDNIVRPYRREIYGKRLCDVFMDKNPLLVEKSMSLKVLSDMITELEPHHLANGFIITDNGRYIGMGSGGDLLKEITQMQINAARYANPITMLPGNVPISEHIDRLLEARIVFHVCYFDLDNFKPFNDAYGFRRGDEVIKYTADILKKSVTQQYDFVGHIGGDDFIVVFQSDDWEKRCLELMKVLEKDIPAFYDLNDRIKGGIETEDRTGKKMFFPFVSISVGVVRIEASQFNSHHDVSSAVNGAKKQAKKIAGNSIFIERRLASNA